MSDRSIFFWIFFRVPFHSNSYLNTFLILIPLLTIILTNFLIRFGKFFFNLTSYDFRKKTKSQSSLTRKTDVMRALDINDCRRDLIESINFHLSDVFIGECATPFLVILNVDKQCRFPLIKSLLKWLKRLKATRP